MGCDSARLDLGPSFGSLGPYPATCRLWVACFLRVVRSPVVFLVTTHQVAASLAALPDWSCGGAQYLGKTATWCPQVVFSPQAQAWTRWQIGGDCNAIVRCIGGRGSVSRLSSPIPGPRGSRGHTCRTLPRTGVCKRQSQLVIVGVRTVG